MLNIAKSVISSRTASLDYEDLKKANNEHSNNKEKQEKDKFSIISALELKSKVFPPINYLVKDFLPVGTGILSAASKMGKSWLVLDMGLSIALGKPFLGKQTSQAGVLYLALEDNQRRLQDRMNKVLKDSTTPNNFYFSTSAPTLDNGLLEYMECQLKECPEIKLVIIDTFQKIRGLSKGHESAYQYDCREMGAIKEFADKHELSIFFVHHNRKMVDKEDSFI